jgi:CheY-like chemotaxis protein
MNDPAVTRLIRGLRPQTKALILESEARGGVLSCDQLAELLDLLASGPDERMALAAGVLENLTLRGRTPAGRVQDLHAAFGVPEVMPAGSAAAGPAEEPAPVDMEKTTTISTVLVADDDAHLRRLFRTKLEAEGFRVIEAPDGREAWRLLQTAPIQALVLDLKMPGLHGLEILERLSESGGRLPVVVCTAYDRAEDEYAVISYPALRFLTKPVDPGHLAETVINLLAESA